MSELPKSIIKILGFVFLLLVLTFTAIQTWSLLYAVSKNAITATAGLVLFEGGMIYWWLTFQKSAEGITQMAISLVWAIIGLILVAGSTALHLQAIDATILGDHTPARLITMAAIINLVGKFAFPLVAPETFQNIMTRTLEGSLMLHAYKEAEAQMNERARELASLIGQHMVKQMTIQLLTSKGLEHTIAHTETPIDTDGDGQPDAQLIQPQPENAEAPRTPQHIPQGNGYPKHP